MKRITWTATLLVWAAICTVAQAQIMLGSRKAVLDSLTGNWLCSVPEAVFGSDFSATFHGPEQWVAITIDGDTVVNGTNYTFADVAGDRRYTLRAMQADNTVVTGDISFTFCPILELEGTFTDDYQIVTTVAHLPDQQAPQPMLSKVKHRGGITNEPSRLKRNYHIKFINPDSTKMDRKFFGLRNDNSWILDAGQIDLLRIRNRVATELWMDMCHAPYYADQESKALSGVRGDFVEVFLNGKYNGMYAFTEAMDRKQMKLVKYDDNDSLPPDLHGMLWKSKGVSPITRMYSSYTWVPNNNYPMWDYFEVKYPDPDEVMPTDYTTLYQAARFVSTSSITEFKQHVAEYFDLPVMMDYWIFTNAILAVDNGTKNIYWGVYDQQQDKKLTLAVWDLDCTFGQNWHNDPPHNEAIVGPEVALTGSTNLLLRMYMHNPDSIAVKAVERYHQLRQNLLSEHSLKQRFRDRLQPLARSGMLERERQRWSHSSDISYQALDFESELQYIEQWIDRRLVYLDNGRFMTIVMGDADRNGLVDVADVSQVITEMLRGDDPMWYEDFNGDDRLDITDLNAVINTILSKNTP